MTELNAIKQRLEEDAKVLSEPEWWFPIMCVEWWSCGDEHCNCNQIQIVLITPNRIAGEPWICRSPVWQGGFFSEPSTEEYSFLEEDMAEAIEKIGVTREVNWRYATREELGKHSNPFAHKALKGIEHVK